MIGLSDCIARRGCVLKNIVQGNRASLRRVAIPVYLAFASLVSHSVLAEQDRPPTAERHPHEVKAPFGAVRDDEYYWLRDDTRKDPKIRAYLNAENAYTDHFFKSISGLRERVRQELASRIPQEDSSVPVRKRGYWYYSRYTKGQEYPVIARRKGDLTAPEEVLLDQPTMAPKSGYFNVGANAVSPNNRLIAWTEDRVGRFQYSLHVREIGSGRELVDSVDGINPGIVWGNDNKTILYIVNDPALRPRWVKAHVLGTPASADRVLIDESDDTFYQVPVRTTDGRFVCISGFGMLNSEWRCANADTPTVFKSVAPREPGHLYDVDHIDGRWIIRTNWNAPNYKLMTMPDEGLGQGRATWRDWISSSTSALIEGYKPFSGFIAIQERSEANKLVRLVSRDGRSQTVPAEDPAYAMTLAADQDPTSRWVRFTYESLASPKATFEVNVDSGQRRLLKQEVVSGYDKSNYVTERAWVTGREGTRIPVSLFHRKEWRKDGQSALFQYAYGSYGGSQDAKFTAYAVSLADRGILYAIAHVRGGQEMGSSWYAQGRRHNKINTINDFIDVTRGLVAQGYAKQGRVAALGGSGGGFLMGNVANMAPADYAAIIAMVPFVDAVTTMLDPSIPLVTREYDEWGNPQLKEDYDYMLRVSPYDNVRKQAYPAMYVGSGLWDSQVQYYEPTKWVAKLRANKTDTHPLVLRMNMEAGHGGASGRFRQSDSQAEYLSFAISQLGVDR